MRELERARRRLGSRCSHTTDKRSKFWFPWHHEGMTACNNLLQVREKLKGRHWEGKHEVVRGWKHYLSLLQAIIDMYGNTTRSPQRRTLVHGGQIQKASQEPNTTTILIEMTCSM